MQFPGALAKPVVRGDEPSIFGHGVAPVSVAPPPGPVRVTGAWVVVVVPPATVDPVARVVPVASEVVVVDFDADFLLLSLLEKIEMITTKTTTTRIGAASRM